MPPKPPCPSVQAAARWRECGESPRPRRKQTFDGQTLFRYAKVLLSIITFFFCVSWILIGLLAYLYYRNEEDCDKGNLAVPIHLMSERQTRRGSSN